MENSVVWTFLVRLWRKVWLIIFRSEFRSGLTLTILTSAIALCVKLAPNFFAVFFLLFLIPTFFWFQSRKSFYVAIARIFQFKNPVKTIGAVVKDLHGIDTMSQLERDAIDKFLIPRLHDFRFNTEPTFSGSHQCPIEHDKDFVLVGGPERNRLSSQVNEKLSTMPDFDGFIFKRYQTEPKDDPEACWCIVHNRLETLKAPYCGLPKDGATEDYALLYIGPNPCNQNKWLVWAAGIGPAGSYSAISILANEEYRDIIGAILKSRKNYCSVLVNYKIVNGNYTDGQVAMALVCRGSIK